VLRNARIEEDIRSALDLDPRIRDPRTIAVFADGIGTVSLRGTVGSLRQKRAAGDDARGVDGVFEGSTVSASTCPGPAAGATTSSAPALCRRSWRM